MYQRTKEIAFVTVELRFDCNIAEKILPVEKLLRHLFKIGLQDIAALEKRQIDKS